jgi:hypothetical protein
MEALKYCHFSTAYGREIWLPRKIDRLAEDCGLTWKDNNAKATTHRVLSWQRLEDDFIKQDVDGSSLAGNPGKAGFGGLIRNREGLFVVRFTIIVGFEACTWSSSSLG